MRKDCAAHGLDRLPEGRYPQNYEYRSSQFASPSHRAPILEHIWFESMPVSGTQIRMPSAVGGQTCALNLALQAANESHTLISAWATSGNSTLVAQLLDVIRGGRSASAICLTGAGPISSMWAFIIQSVRRAFRSTAVAAALVCRLFKSLDPGRGPGDPKALGVMPVRDTACHR